MLIFIVNLALIAGLFAAAMPGVDMREIGNVWLDMAKSGWRLLAHLFGAGGA